MTDGSGCIEKPVTVLNRIELIKRMASTFLHHDRGEEYLNAFDTTQAFWDSFLAKCKIDLTLSKLLTPLIGMTLWMLWR